ncbi:hypothetical protein FJV76_13550 [Mesorhizobium sp. WSM4303]|uniref:hypothetical protein n=1 Tax=unclassified Mesorhizobium TaxID=325217 RepID=UPI00115E67AB|nr:MULTISPECIES: hypothetical protein [unclassified Mesorhizobium]TRC98332.1 hypothetical protein FJV77_07660 [Mesorhizobium sp. WSM4306]TRD04310.1 hypothetical protein FJV76_13550 [Mesorhizobium sp. WSM4303]
MDDDLRRRLKELSIALQHRAKELSLTGASGDIAILMSGAAITLEALVVIAEEAKAPRSGPSVDPLASAPT